MALSSSVIAGINFIAILLAIPIIGVGIWLSTLPDSSCVSVLQWPLIILGVLILIVAIAGFIGAFWRVGGVVIFYMVSMLVLLILLVSLSAFVYMITLRGGGHMEPSRSYLEYHLDDFSGWLRRRVEADYKWIGIKNCLVSSSLCVQMNESYTMAQTFFNAHLNPIESGCCKPPTQCGYTFLNPTNWISPINTAADSDCLAWSNDQVQLCYGCNSCKAGLLASLRKEWRRANVVLIITLIALVAVYLLGCCAFRNAQTEDLFKKYKQGYT